MKRQAKKQQLAQVAAQQKTDAEATALQQEKRIQELEERLAMLSSNAAAVTSVEAPKEQTWGSSWSEWRSNNTWEPAWKSAREGERWSEDQWKKTWGESGDVELDTETALEPGALETVKEEEPDMMVDPWYEVNDQDPPKGTISEVSEVQSLKPYAENQGWVKKVATN